MRPYAPRDLPNRGRHRHRQRDVHRRRIRREPRADNEPAAAGHSVSRGRRGAGRRPHVLRRFHRRAADADPCLAVTLPARPWLHLFQHRVANRCVQTQRRFALLQVILLRRAIAVPRVDSCPCCF